MKVTQFFTKLTSSEVNDKLEEYNNSNLMNNLDWSVNTLFSTVIENYKPGETLVFYTLVLERSASR